MKTLFAQNTKFKNSVLIILALLFILIIARSVFSVISVNKSLEKDNLSLADEKIRATAWHDLKTRNLWKENNWLEKQLALSKSEKINIGIDLNDSTVQVQLKGTVLLQAKILK